ncbi:Hydroxylamine reductase [Tritrichomonas foetus]|uniref:Hydroxylamine reductase n=1 Tax=Tritrichomonas foetus TaxID=1144522 RepID=A0A1J4J4L0_9EUKA|nr:Hydroxylamine reductase [Tritrichomonas foetus]|eukprot:OHS93087.1 Hydroxylamine reductase [Tritrichomonas foetus]
MLTSATAFGSLSPNFAFGARNASILDLFKRKDALENIPKKGMFCFQCQETNENKGCTEKGMCGKKAYTANLQDKLVSLCKEISLACEANGEVSNEVGIFIINSLFMTITNANFDDDRFRIQIECANRLLKSLAKSEIKPAPCGVKSNDNPDIVSLREVITYGLKGLAAYTEHAYNLDKEDPEIYRFVVKCLADLTKDLSIDELIQLTLECGNYAVKAMKLLDEANTSAYGHPQITKVNIGVGTRPGILVSGHDLRDLKDLLEQTKDSGIDVYTHGEMLPAHYYPELKKYPHLFGNYGGSWWKQDQEFGPFNGPILMTTNCIVPVKKAYKNRIFTTGAVGYEGLQHIPDRPKGGQKDFSQIIALAKKCKPPTELEKGEIVGGFAHNQVFALADQIVEAVKSGAIKKFVVMGGCDGRHASREYFTKMAQALPKDSVILTAGCAKYRYNKLPLGDINGIPRVLDAGQCNDSYSLAIIALKLKEIFGLDDVNKLPLAFDIGWYEQKAVAVLLALLALGFKNVRLGPTLPGFLTPNVANILVKNFGISVTSTVEEDIQKIIT